MVILYLNVQNIAKCKNCWQIENRGYFWACVCQEVCLKVISWHKNKKLESTLNDLSTWRKIGNASNPNLTCEQKVLFLTFSHQCLRTHSACNKLIFLENMIQRYLRTFFNPFIWVKSIILILLKVFAFIHCSLLISRGGASAYCTTAEPSKYLFAYLSTLYIS